MAGNHNNYVWQKFHQAVDALATSSESIQRRVVHAATFLCYLQRDHFAPGSDELIERWGRLMARMTRVSGPDGSIEATCSGLTDREAEEIAQEIFDTSCSLDSTRFST